MPDIDVLTCNVHYAETHLSELLRFARTPGHYVRVIDGSRPARQAWLGSEPPPGWECHDDTDALVALRSRQISQARRSAALAGTEVSA